MKELLEAAKARALSQRAVKLARGEGAKEAVATLEVSRRGHLRFAENGPTTSGEAGRRELTLQASIGRKHASASSEDLSSEGLARLAAQVVAQARLTPEDPEWVREPPAQKYTAIPGAFDPAVAAADPAVRAEAVRPVIEAALQGGLTAAGLYQDTVRELIRFSSAGSVGAHKSTAVELSMTLRKPDGSASAWAGAAGVRASDIDGQKLALRAAEKALQWVNPEVLPPGKYTVVLEPAAVGGLLDFVDRALDARAAEEGHSAFSAPGGRTREGDALFAGDVTLDSDPADALSPGLPWAEGGLRAEPQNYAQAGVLKQLRRSRYWAQKTSRKPTADGGVLRLAGGDSSLEQLLAKVDRGLLVTRVWYVRELDPHTIGVTGLTRDATFLVEGGKIAHAVRNFRFNQSLVDMLANVQALGRVERTPASHSPVPAALVKDFHMSSVSEAI